MTATKTAAAATSELGLEYVDLDLITPHPNNIRQDVGDVTELAASIREKGILEPLIIAPHSNRARGGGYTLIAGHRRHAAAALAELTTAPCIIRRDLVDNTAQLEHMLVENLQRVDLSPIEEGDAYQLLLDLPGYTAKKLAKTTGRSPATIKSRLSLAKLPKSARDQVHSGQLTLGNAELIVGVAGNKAEFTRLSKAIEDGRLEYEIKEIKRKRDAAAKKKAAIAKLTAAGVRVVTRQPSIWGSPVTAKSLYGDQQIDGHRECPGFCAYVQANEWSSSVTISYYCDQWNTLHPEAAVANSSTSTDVDEPDPGVAAALLDAQAARREHLAAIFNDGPTDAMALEALRAYARQYVVDQCDGWVLRQVLGIDPDGAPLVDTLDDDGNAVEPPSIEQRVEARIEHLDICQLALLYDIAENSTVDDRHTNTYTWRNESEWRDRLAGPYGYEWSEIEAELLDAAEAERLAVSVPAVVDAKSEAVDAMFGSET